MIPINFSLTWKHSSLINAVVTNGKHGRVDWTISHESPHSGQGCGRGSSTGASRRDHGGCGAGLRDGSAVKDGSSIKAQLVDRSAPFLLKIELIPGSHAISNSSIMRASLIGISGETCVPNGWLPHNLGVTRNNHLIVNCTAIYYMDIHKICIFHRNLLIV